MKRLVNGSEVDLQDSDSKVFKLADRYLVVNGAGSWSAVSVRVGNDVLVSLKGRQFRVQPIESRKPTSLISSGRLGAPMPGQIVDIRVVVGDKAKAGQTLVVLEAMKTQQPITSPHNGIVKELSVALGQQVSEGQFLVYVKEERVE